MSQIFVQIRSIDRYRTEISAWVGGWVGGWFWWVGDDVIISCRFSVNILLQIF